jgi:hypothetical protein
VVKLGGILTKMYLVEKIGNLIPVTLEGDVNSKETFQFEQ